MSEPFQYQHISISPRSKAPPLPKSCLLFLLLSLWLPRMSYGFTSPISNGPSNELSSLTRQTRIGKTLTRSRHAYSSSLSQEASPVGTSFGSQAEREDARKDNEFTVGAIVRVAVDGVKAYQVKPAGYGKFDADKNFVPAPEGAPRSARNLLIPVGMRGVVTKVFNVDDISANFPIQVTFTPGENVDEGYDPPEKFVMHLLPEELELV